MTQTEDAAQVMALGEREETLLAKVTDLYQQIASLEACRDADAIYADSQRHALDAAQATIAQQSARIAELEEALRPFANIGTKLIGVGPKNGLIQHPMRISDFRRAAQALAAGGAHG